MENSKDLLEMYIQYLLLYSKEIARLDIFKKFINAFSGQQLYNRKNFEGHITASAIVVDITDLTVLLLEHKKLKRWLQPGGHVDLTDESILAAALRELNEEANINANQLRLVSSSNQTPFDIDSHLIPENSKTGTLSPRYTIPVHLYRYERNCSKY